MKTFIVRDRDGKTLARVECEDGLTAVRMAFGIVEFKKSLRYLQVVEIRDGTYTLVGYAHHDGTLRLG